MNSTLKLTIRSTLKLTIKSTLNDGRPDRTLREPHPGRRASRRPGLPRCERGTSPAVIGRSVERQRCYIARNQPTKRVSALSARLPAPRTPPLRARYPCIFSPRDFDLNSSLGGCLGFQVDVIETPSAVSEVLLFFINPMCWSASVFAGRGCGRC